MTLHHNIAEKVIFKITLLYVHLGRIISAIIVFSIYFHFWNYQEPVICRSVVNILFPYSKWKGF